VALKASPIPIYFTPFDPPLYFVKRGKLNDIEYFTPPLCEAEMGTGGEFIGSRAGWGVSSVDR